MEIKKFSGGTISTLIGFILFFPPWALLGYVLGTAMGFSFYYILPFLLIPIALLYGALIRLTRIECNAEGIVFYWYGWAMRKKTTRISWTDISEVTIHSYWYLGTHFKEYPLWPVSISSGGSGSLRPWIYIRIKNGNDIFKSLTLKRSTIRELLTVIQSEYNIKVSSEYLTNK